jgi:hypothetical protein
MSVDNLLNFNGSHGQAVFTDDGLDPRVWSIENGAPILSNVITRFGSTSLRLDGLSNLLCTNFSLGDSTTSVWTIECWVYMDTPLETTAAIITFDTTTIRGLYYTINGGGSFSWYDNGGQCYMNQLQTPVVPEQWYHIAVTCDNGRINLFCNGAKAITSFDSIFDYTGHDARIGKYGVGATMSSPFKGYIDGLRITRDEILYNALTKPSNDLQTEPSLTTVLAPTLPVDQAIVEQSVLTYQTNVVTGILGGIIIGGDNTPVVIQPPPTSVNIVAGNISKLGLPFGARVVVMSTGLNPDVVGSGESNEITGDYSIDVYPYASECLIYVAPNYGNAFIADSFVGIDTVIHPTTPNRYIYVAQNSGTVGSAEPNWPTVGFVNSGTVSFLAVGLHRPLMNGFVKPVVTPI